MRALKLLVLPLLVGCSSAYPHAPRLALVLDAWGEPRAHRHAASLSLRLRPSPPRARVSREDEPLPSPRTRLPRCRSHHGLCPFEQHSVAEALAAMVEVAP